MKIAVYTCALNEEQFVERWVTAAKDADQLLVIDTGSTDRTIDILRDLTVDVRTALIKPWRFDDAKNMALFSLDDSIDIAIQVDADEVLTPGWRSKIEAVWKSDTTRLKYLYTCSWLSPDHPDTVFYADKISGRFTHRWRGPAHETLVPTVPEVIAVCDSTLIEHRPDSSEKRSDYLSLLHTAIEEEPLNDRYAHYYARELYYNKEYKEAIEQFYRHLQLSTSTWLAERASSFRYIAKCHENLQAIGPAYNSYVLATLEDSQSRESLIDLANFLLRQKEWAGVVHFCGKAASLPSEPNYISERYAREEGPFDLASVALYNLGQRGPALEFAKRALAFNPNDARLRENVRLMENEGG
jgi:glycosyltransferase involved in cell wall biosynthesis